MWSMSPNLRIKLNKRLKSYRAEKEQNFYWRENVREKEGDGSNFSLQSTEIGWSKFVRPRMKVHLLNEGYAWVPKTRDFAEDSSEEFGKSKVSGLGSVHGTS